MLWIDGDHALGAVALDFALLREHLRPGAVVALHDVLNPFEGPIGVFCDSVLAVPDFGARGLCGPIGWARRTGSGARRAPNVRTRPNWPDVSLSCDRWFAADVSSWMQAGPGCG